MCAMQGVRSVFRLFKESIMSRKSLRATSSEAKSAQPTKRRKLGVKALEQRALLAADIGVAEGFVTIEGSDDADVAEVHIDGDHLVIEVGVANSAGEVTDVHSESLLLSDVHGIFFRGGAGDDVFVNETGINSIAIGGSGNDVLVGGS